MRVVLLALVLAVPALAQEGFTFIAPPADGTANTFAYDVSDDGAVVVGSYASAGSGGRAFRWTANGGAEALVATSEAFQPTYAYAASADGSVIVGSGRDGSSTGAFRWTAADGVVRLDGLPGSGLTFASGVSDDGTVIVGSSTVSSRSRAVLWTDGTPEDLGLLGEFNECFGTAVSADGSVAVGACSRFTTGVGTQSEAFRWTRDGGMVGLGDLDATESVPAGSAQAVSADGAVIVGAGGGQSRMQQIRWTAETGLEGLPFGFPEYTGRARALSISADGTVVGGNDFANSSAPTGVLWSAPSGTVAIYDAVMSPLTPPDGLLTDVYGLSADGTVAVGNSIRWSDGLTRAWVADVQLPTASDEAPGPGLALAVAPNPAAGRATVTVSMPAAGVVRVEAFDVLGRRVAVLYDGALAAGTHRLALLASTLPSGVVVVRVQTDRAVATRPLTVVR